MPTKFGDCCASNFGGSGGVVGSAAERAAIAETLSSRLAPPRAYDVSVHGSSHLARCRHRSRPASPFPTVERCPSQVRTLRSAGDAASIVAVYDAPPSRRRCPSVAPSRPATASIEPDLAARRALPVARLHRLRGRAAALAAGDGIGVLRQPLRPGRRASRRPSARPPPACRWRRPADRAARRASADRRRRRSPRAPTCAAR